MKMPTKNPSLIPVAVFALLLGGCSSKPTQQPAAEAPKAEAPKPVAEAPPAPTHAIVGQVQQVDPQGAYIVVKTADGKQQRVQTTPDTEFGTLKHGTVEIAKGAEGFAKLTAAEVKKGTMVTVRYTEKEGKLIAHEVGHAARKTVKQSEVVFQKMEQGGEKIIVKTTNGAEEVYDVGKRATVTTGNKITEAGKWTGDKVVAGTKATISYTEEAGKKVVHFVEQK